MLYETLKALHVLSIVVWVGGMVFAHFFLRPAVAALEGPQRIRLMHDVLGRFFRVVLVVSVLALATGVWMLGRVARQVVQAGGNFQMPLAWTVMAVLGTVMVAIFLVIRFRFFRGLHQAVAQTDWAAGAAHLAQIRKWVAVNLALGIFVTAVAFTAGA
jgi:uncharacterized membrane protein